MKDNSENHEKKEESINVKTETHLETEDQSKASPLEKKINIINTSSNYKINEITQEVLDMAQNTNPQELNIINENQEKIISSPIKINESNTIATSQVFLTKSEIMEGKDPYMDLNKSLPVMQTKKVSAMELGQQNKETNGQKMGLFGKTKQWAGNVWRSMTNVNLGGTWWRKMEYEDAYDSSGNKIKVPKKKIPLKKQPAKPDPEEKRVIYQVKEDQQTYSVKSFEGFPYGGFFI